MLRMSHRPFEGILLPFKNRVSKLSYVFWATPVDLLFLSEFSNEYRRSKFREIFQIRTGIIPRGVFNIFVLD